MVSPRNNDILKKIEMIEDGLIFKIEYITRFNILKINTEIQEGLMNDDVTIKIEYRENRPNHSLENNL